MAYGVASDLYEWQNPRAVEWDEVKKRRKRLHWTQGELAEKAAVNVETIVRIEAKGNVRMDTLRRVENALTKAERDLPLHGRTPVLDDVEDFDRDITHGYKKHDVPVVGDAEASTNGIIAWSDEGIVKTQVEQWVSRAFSEGDPKAYALRVRGDSMVPRYFPGEIVIAQPRLHPKDGDFACVQLVNGERLIKRVFRSSGGWLLRSMNEAYPTREVTNDEVHAIHVIKHSVARM
jgi:phage repressor protein C with HTH and peptisase S24 domain